MRKFLKIILYILCFLIVIIASAVVWLNTQSGKNFVRGKAEAFLRNKLKTEVAIGKLGYGLPKYINLENVMFKDLQKDTLLSVGKLEITLDMWALIHKQIDVNKILLENTTAYIHRSKHDTDFNFSFIIAAFSGSKPDTSTKKTGKSSPFKIDVNLVKLDNIHVRFSDYASGNILALSLEHLSLKMNSIDLDSMQFHLKELAINGVQTSYTKDSSYLPVTVSTDTTKPHLRLVADNIKLQNISAHYNDNLNKFLFDMGLGELQVGVEKFDLETASVAVNDLSLSNTDVAIIMGKFTKAPAVIDTIKKMDSTLGWTVTSKKVNLRNVNFKMDNENNAPTKAGIDYSHLNTQEIALQLNDLLYRGDTINGDIKHFAVREKRGLVINDIRGDVRYNNQGATLKNLFIQTPNTTLRDFAEVHYTSLDAATKHPETMQVKVNLKGSVIGIADILQFAPFLTEQKIVNQNKTGKLKIDANVSGYVNKLNIGKFNLSGIENTEVAFSGKLNGLPDAKKINYDLKIARLKSNKKVLMYFVTPEQLSSVRVPDNFSVTGAISGTTQDYNPNLFVSTSDGDISLKGCLYLSPGKDREKYDIAANAVNFDAGKIFKQDSLMGKFTATVSVRGIGFDPKTMAASFAGNIKSAAFKYYPYSAITFNGKVFNKKGDLSLNSNDPRATAQLTAHADFNSKYIAAILDAKIDSIDFQELNLYKDPFRIHGTIHADFPELNPDYPKGVFTWKDPVISINGQRYAPDSIIITSKPTEDSGQNIYAYLDFLQANLTGKIPLSKLPVILEDHLNRNYKVLLTDSLKESISAKTDTTVIASDYSINLLATITDKPLLHGFLPKLNSFDSIHIDGKLTQRDLALNIAIPKIVYDSSAIQNANVAVTGSDSSLTYKVTADRLNYNKFELWYADIHGSLGQDNITTSISLSDADRKERFALGATMQQQGTNKIIQLQPGLKLDYNTWDVAQPNSLTITNKGYYINNLVLSKNLESIKINSEQQKDNATIRADINNFVIGNITRPISKSDTTLADGVLSGYATYSNTDGAMKIVSDLQVKNLTVLTDTLGDLKVFANTNKPDVVDAKITLLGNGNDLSITGNYFLKTQNSNDLDLILKLNSVNLHSFEHFAQNSIKNSSGSVKGDLQIRGTISSPSISGELATDKLKTTVTQLNAEYRMPNEKIVFKDGIASFNKFTILDSSGNKAVLDGDVNIEDPTNPYFNLNVASKNWRAVHSRKEHNKLFFGDLYLTTNLNIKGTSYFPIVDGNINILKGTDMTVVTPESNPELESNKGIVVFRNMHDSSLKKALVARKKDSSITKVARAKGSNINVNITIDKQAQLSMVLDQSTGDFIKVRGVAALNTYFMPDGTIGLTGNYELHEGAYQLNYNFIKRRFNIKDGSTILFAGDPINGTNLNLTAVYSANIAPYDLVQKEIQDPQQLNYYKQKLPFDVELHMKGAILKPSLSFNIILPDNKVYPLSSGQIELIQGKLNQLHQDTSQLNKQVFAVLLLSRFVADDPFSSGASSGVGTAALQSVSRFIGEQLNQAAGRFVKGVDLSVDLATTDDYTTGDLRQRTDLSLAASKRLLDDRLKLTLGNDFELDGPQANKSDQNNLIPSNLSADYALTEDGRYSLRAYRKNYNEGVLQGYVTESGLDFIVSLDYNKFRNVFKKRNPTNKETKN